MLRRGDQPGAVKIIIKGRLQDETFPENERMDTLQEINISHLGKRKIIFKMPFFGVYVSSLEGNGYP